MQNGQLLKPEQFSQNGQLPTPRYPHSTPLYAPDDSLITQSLYLPLVPRNARRHLPAIFEQHVGKVERIDWFGPKGAFVHFSMWYDTPVAEDMFVTVVQDNLSYRLKYGSGLEAYLICRNRTCFPMQNGLSDRYTLKTVRCLQNGLSDRYMRKTVRCLYHGPYSAKQLAEFVDTLSTAYIYGRCKESVLVPKHIRFDEDGTPTVVEYRVLPQPSSQTPDNQKNKNKLVTEYSYWMNLLIRGSS
jgi:hypothetical protein